MKFLYPLAAASVAAFFLSLTALAWLYGRPILIHANGAITRIEGVESKINASAVNLDKATKAWSDSAKGQADAVEDLVTDAHGTLAGVDNTLDALQVDAKAVQGSADALTGEIGSLHATTDALPPLVADIDTDAKAAKDVMEDTNLTLSSYSNAADDLDQLLKRKSIDQTLDNMAALTQNANGILVDGRKVSDKLTNDFVAPKPWWKKIGPSLEDVWDYGALVARHTP